MNTKYSLVLKEEFINDLAEVIKWYNERSRELGDTLYQETNATLIRIESYPEGFESKNRNYRQALLNRFPYVIVYKIYKSEVVVFALFHTSRNPRKKYKR